MRDLADFLADAGQVVGGGAVFGATLGFLAALIVRDSGLGEPDPIRWAERTTLWGGVFGLVALVYRAAGVD